MVHEWPVQREPFCSTEYPTGRGGREGGRKGGREGGREGVKEG